MVNITSVRHRWEVLSGEVNVGKSLLSVKVPDGWVGGGWANRGGEVERWETLMSNFFLYLAFTIEV